MKKKKTNNKTIVRPRMIHAGSRLGICSAEWMKSLIDPFQRDSAVCMPDLCSIDSRKVTYFSKGTFSTSTTNNFGFIAYNPFRAAYTTAVAGQMALRTTAAAFGATAIDCSNATVGVVSTQPNSSDSLSDTGGIQYRLVSAGIRVRYGGTELNRGGRFTAVEHPQHQNLHGLNTPGLNNFDSSRETSEQMNDWYGVVYCPKASLEEGYCDIASEPNLLAGSYTSVAAAADTLPGNPYCLAITANSAVAAQTIVYEAFSNFETIGSKVRGKTPSYMDPVGYAAVSNSVGTLRPFNTKELPAIYRALSNDVMRNLSMQSSSGG